MDAIINSMLQVVLFNLAGLYQAVRQDLNLLEIAILVGLLIAIRRRGFANRLTFVSSWEAALARDS